MGNIWDKPIRWIFKGDEVKSHAMIGEAKRVLYQLKNIQSAGSSQYMLSKRYVDGSSVNVRTDVQGLDIIKIFTPSLVLKGAKGIIEEEKLVVGGYLNTSPQTTKVDTWPLSLSSHTEAVASDADWDQYFVGKIAIDQKRAEAWVGGGFDKVHCFNVKTGDYVTSININPYSTWETWEQIYSLAIDESEDLLFVGTDHAGYPPGGVVYAIDLKTRTIINTINMIAGNYHNPYVMNVINKTYNDIKYHNLYIATNSHYIDYYSLPDMTLKGTIDLLTYGMQPGSSSVNYKKGYIYYTNGFDDIVRLDIKTGLFNSKTYPDHECISTAVNEKTGNVYVHAMQKIGLGGKNAVVSFDEDLNLLSASSGFGAQYEWGNAIVIQHDGNYLYAILWGHASNNYKGSVNKIKTENLEIIDTQYSSHVYTSAAMYYKEREEE